MLKLIENRSTTILAAHLLEFVFCEAGVTGSCSLSHIIKHCGNANPGQVDQAVRKLVSNGYIRMEGDTVALELGKQNCFYTGFVKHPALGRITFEFETTEKATNSEKDAAAYSALVSSFNEAGIEIVYIVTNCSGEQ